MKQTALNTQVCIVFVVLKTKVVLTSDGYVCAVSSSKPAGTFNDPRQMNEEFDTLFEVEILLLLYL